MQVGSDLPEWMGLLTSSIQLLEVGYIYMHTKHIHSCTSANIKSCFLYIRVVGRIIFKHIILVWWCSMTVGLPSSAGWSGWYGFTGQIHGLRSQETLVSTLDSSLLAVISHWLFVGFRYYINLYKPPPIFRTWNSCLKLVCQICVLGATKWFWVYLYMHPQIFRTLGEDWMRIECWLLHESKATTKDSSKGFATPLLHWRS